MRNSISIVIKFSKEEYGVDIETFFRAHKDIEKDKSSVIMGTNIRFDSETVEKVFESNSDKYPKLLIFNGNQPFAVADIIKITKKDPTDESVGPKCTSLYYDLEDKRTHLQLANLKKIKESNILSCAILAFRRWEGGKPIYLKESINGPDSRFSMCYITWPDF
ncbi:hypothetical protein COF45_25120 [Bacillus wiedmannii]|uniref:hypothetical protein n=1 Tax=Bacillus wiedmannii TaxID=1890302 RepID=UPI000BFE5E58|nr:hypothetical protein [Bacillus wiedmannii]PHD06617.1 hypothetical protein COF45_25120 [Bacillus wiedmannii]